MSPCLPRQVDQKRMEEALRENPRREGEDVCHWLDRVAVAAGALTLSQADTIKPEPDPEAWREENVTSIFGPREPGSDDL